mmetsp:Transcript_48094/g.150527  ORF Transcript_48094/g.150527 Transcript_48094/m.150527 type:complete len:282 (+) Transcript_48094:283-1128(+)
MLDVLQLVPDAHRSVWLVGADYSVERHGEPPQEVVRAEGVLVVDLQVEGVVGQAHGQEEGAAVPHGIEVVVDCPGPLALLLLLAAQAQRHVGVRDVAQDAAVSVDEIVGGNHANGEHAQLLAVTQHVGAGNAPKAHLALPARHLPSPCRRSWCLGVIRLVENLKVQPSLALGAVQLLTDAHGLTALNLLLLHLENNLLDLQLHATQEVLVHVRVRAGLGQVDDFQLERVGSALHLEDHGRGVPAGVVGGGHGGRELLLVPADLQPHAGAGLPAQAAALAVG